MKDEERRDLWLELARDLSWEPSYVESLELFPPDVSGEPWLDAIFWQTWEEPYKTSFRDYVRTQTEKDKALFAVREAFGGTRSLRSLDRGWLSVIKLHSATLTLAELAAVVGNLRAARFGRSGAWRTMASFGALDEIRHTELPLLLLNDLVRHDAQFDWTHRLYHTNNWISIAARHAFDELLLGSNAIELAVATNFVLETGFTNLQFLGLSSLADQVGDHFFRSMLSSIQSDEARHAQIGLPTLETIVKHDPKYAQYLIDKWFWRSWLLFAVVTGIAMDYLTPVDRRNLSFKELVQEWVGGQFVASLEELGLKRPWYWDSVFEHSLSNYHHMIYASAYSYRATTWFDFVLPGPKERAWLRSHYPESFDAYEPIWDRMTALWQSTEIGVDLAVHGMAIPTFCALCQLVLAHGTPTHNDACHVVHEGERFVFCSEPCRWIFTQEPERYAKTKDIVKRVLAGQAPANLTEFLTRFSDLRYETWGKDAFAGDYDFIKRDEKT